MTVVEKISEDHLVAVKPFLCLLIRRRHRDWGRSQISESVGHQCRLHHLMFNASSKVLYLCGDHWHNHWLCYIVAAAIANWKPVGCEVFAGHHLSSTLKASLLTSLTLQYQYHRAVISSSCGTQVRKVRPAGESCHRHLFPRLCQLSPRFTSPTITRGKSTTFPTHWKLIFKTHCRSPPWSLPLSQVDCWYGRARTQRGEVDLRSHSWPPRLFSWNPPSELVTTVDLLVLSWSAAATGEVAAVA